MLAHRLDLPQRTQPLNVMMMPAYRWVTFNEYVALMVPEVTDLYDAMSSWNERMIHYPHWFRQEGGQWKMRIRAA